MGGACKAGQHNEQFFGASLTPGFGWVVSDVAEGLSRVLNAPGCDLGALVTVNVTMANCAIWNFPS